MRLSYFFYMSIDLELKKNPVTVKKMKFLKIFVKTAILMASAILRRRPPCSICLTALLSTLYRNQYQNKLNTGIFEF